MFVSFNQYTELLDSFEAMNTPKEKKIANSLHLSLFMVINEMCNTGHASLAPAYARGSCVAGRFPRAPLYVLTSLCNDLCQERFLKWPRLSIYFPYYWTEMVMAEMVIGRNDSGPKMYR